MFRVPYKSYKSIVPKRAGTWSQNTSYTIVDVIHLTFCKYHIVLRTGPLFPKYLHNCRCIIDMTYALTDSTVVPEISAQLSMYH